MTEKIKESKSHGAMLSLVGEISRDAGTHAIGQNRGEGGRAFESYHGISCSVE